MSADTVNAIYDLEEGSSMFLCADHAKRTQGAVDVDKRISLTSPDIAKGVNDITSLTTDVYISVVSANGVGGGWIYALWIA